MMNSIKKFLRDFQEALAESLHERAQAELRYQRELKRHREQRHKEEHLHQRERRLIPQPSSPPDSSNVDLDLDLLSGWYAKTPAAFPPTSIKGMPGKRSYSSSSGWSSSGVRKTYTFTGAVRDNGTLATTIIHLTWDASNPEYTVKAQQRHIPPPRKLSVTELEQYRER